MDRDEQLTRQEVAALISASEKVAGQLTLIAERMQSNSEALNKIIGELSNGLPKKIYEPVITESQKCSTKLEGVLADQHEMKWLIRCVAGVVGFIGLRSLAQILITTFKP